MRLGTLLVCLPGTMVGIHYPVYASPTLPGYTIPLLRYLPYLSTASRHVP